MAAALVFFRRTRIAITVVEMTVIKRMITARTPIETPNTRPLTVNELEVPVTVSTQIIKLTVCRESKGHRS